MTLFLRSCIGAADQPSMQALETKPAFGWILRSEATDIFTGDTEPSVPRVVSIPGFGWTLGLGVCIAVMFTSTASAQTAVVESPEVTAELSKGDPITGSLISIDETQVRIKTDTGPQNVAFDRLISLVFPGTASVAPPTTTLLRDGSLLVVTSVAIEKDLLVVVPARQDKLRLPMNAVRAVRFRKPQRATDPAWLGWLEEDRRGDLIAVRRDADTLDSLDATVVQIDRKTVTFNLGESPIEAPREKIEGVIFSGANPSKPTSLARILDRSGSVWFARSISLVDTSRSLMIKLNAGLGTGKPLTHKIPLDQVVRIDFTSGLLPLSQAEVVDQQFGLGKKRGPSNVSLMQDWFGPISGDDAILMHGPGEITFRIPDGFKTFVASVRRDESVSEFTPVEASVLLDGELAWDENVDPSRALGVQLPVGDARQMTLRVRSAAEGGRKSLSVPLGGKILWLRGRLLK